MAFHGSATNKFADDPLRFLEKNFVKTMGGAFLTKVIACRNGAAPALKYLDGLVGTVAYGAMTVNDSNLKTVTGIGIRSAPTCYMGLFDVEPHFYHAEVQDTQDDTHPVLVRFLPTACNQIVRIRIPANPLGPRIMLTEPLSGCTIFVTDDGAGHRYIYHANASAVARGGNDAGRVYMRDMLRAFIAGTAQRATHMFDRPYYEDTFNELQTHWQSKKARLGRDVGAMVSTLQKINVFGVREGGVWDSHYQLGDTISSTRTGVSAFLKGPQSEKFKVSLDGLPAVPPGGVPNP